MAKKKSNLVMDRVRDLFEKSGLSLVELGKKMGYPEDTARQSAWQFMKTSDPRMSMVQRFAQAMGVSLEELGHEGKRMARKLKDELKQHGCPMDADGFRKLLEEKKEATFPAYSFDDLVCRPDDAKRFCELIRAEPSCDKLPDFLILRTLMNVRKSH
ncbi:MAG TPA: helix-turn-helix transcriptional regulator [Gemmataceae bacterium]|nr:helix-turn-helix transcriptional regulator [Gemmataceae bacterium]